MVRLKLLRPDKDLQLNDEKGRPLEWPISSHQEVIVEHKQLVAEGEPLVIRRRDPAWSIPKALVDPVGPEFPLEALAPWHRRYVEELSEQVRMPAACAAVVSLGGLAGAMAKTALVRVQDNDEHPLNLFVGVVAPSGGGKTGVVDEVRAPIDRHFRDLSKQHRADELRYQVTRRLEDRRIRRLEKEASEAEDEEDKDALVDVVVEARAALEADRPRAVQYTTGDPTQAGLVSLLARHGRILLVTDEGDQLFSRVQQRSPKGAEDIEALLQGYSGAAIERDVQGRPTQAPNPALSILLGIQPGPFAKVFGVRAYHDKGLLGRFLFALVPKGTRVQKRTGLSAEARKRWTEIMEGLLRRPIHDRDDAEPPRVVLTKAALDRFAQFGAEIERSLHDGDLAGLPSWGNKLWGSTARLAGILHLADHALEDKPSKMIPLETVERAIRIATFFQAHAIVAYKHSVRSSEDENARTLLSWIEGRKTSKFRGVEATRAMSGRLTALKISAALDWLVEEGYLREVEAARIGATGRNPKPSYEVNPLVFESARKN